MMNNERPPAEDRYVRITDVIGQILGIALGTFGLFFLFLLSIAALRWAWGLAF